MTTSINYELRYPYRYFGAIWRIVIENQAALLPNVIGLDEERFSMYAIRKNNELSGLHIRAIVDVRDERKLLGVVGISQVNATKGNIYVAISNDSRRRGLAERAIAEIMEMGRKELNITEYIIHTQTENTAMRKVAEKLKFKLGRNDGKDTVYYFRY